MKLSSHLDQTKPTILRTKQDAAALSPCKLFESLGDCHPLATWD